MEIMKLIPTGKDYLWGGTRLREEYGKKIDLTDLQQLNDSEIELYTLSANQEKGVTFDSEKWELPQVVSNKKKAVSNFRASFVFSINR